MKNYKLITQEFAKLFQDQLEKYTVKPTFTECWIWFGQRDRYGYGVINNKEGHFFVHRLSYQLHKGDLEQEQILRHSCDDPACCNPDHLTPGTQADNMKDAAKRGRTARGSRSNMAKLTEAQVREIKDRYKPYRGVFADLAREYKVHDETIRYIITGKNWKHVEVSNPHLPQH